MFSHLCRIGYLVLAFKSSTFCIDFLVFYLICFILIYLFHYLIFFATCLIAIRLFMIIHKLVFV